MALHRGRVLVCVAGGRRTPELRVLADVPHRPRLPAIRRRCSCRWVCPVWGGLSCSASLGSLGWGWFGWLIVSRMTGKVFRRGSVEMVALVEGMARQPSQFESGLGVGDIAFGDYVCGSCGYGVSVFRVLPPCPMCRGSAWRRDERTIQTRPALSCDPLVGGPGCGEASCR